MHQQSRSKGCCETALRVLLDAVRNVHLCPGKKARAMSIPCHPGPPCTHYGSNEVRWARGGTEKTHEQTSSDARLHGPHGPRGLTLCVFPRQARLCCPSHPYLAVFPEARGQSIIALKEKPSSRPPAMPDAGHIPSGTSRDPTRPWPMAGLYALRAKTILFRRLAQPTRLPACNSKPRTCSHEHGSAIDVAPTFLIFSPPVGAIVAIFARQRSLKEAWHHVSIAVPADAAAHHRIRRSE